MTKKATLTTGAKPADKRPGKAETLDMEQLQVTANAVACFKADDAGNESLTIFADLFGAARDFDSFEILRKLWVKTYTAQGSSVEAARQAFSERMKKAGLKKPQNDSAEAARKRAERAIKKAQQGAAMGAGDANDDGEGGDPKAGAASAAVKAVRMELAPMEAHVVNLIRQGKYEMAAECIAKMADSAALV